MEYSRLTMLWLFQVNSQGTHHTYTCIHSPLNSPLIQAATSHWAEFPLEFNFNSDENGFYVILFEIYNFKGGIRSQQSPLTTAPLTSWSGPTLWTGPGRDTNPQPGPNSVFQTTTRIWKRLAEWIMEFPRTEKPIKPSLAVSPLPPCTQQQRKRGSAGKKAALSQETQKWKQWGNWPDLVPNSCLDIWVVSNFPQLSLWSLSGFCLGSPGLISITCNQES